MVRWCRKELDVRAEVVAALPACAINHRKSAGLASQSFCPISTYLSVLNLTASELTHLQALLDQQGTPGSTATLSPTFRRLTPGPTSTTVLQWQRANMLTYEDDRRA